MSVSLKSDSGGSAGSVQLNGVDILLFNADGTLSGSDTPAAGDVSKKLATTEFVAGSYAPVLHIRDQRASGTTGQALSAGTWNIRTLQTVILNQIAGASIASNQITLPAGTYDIVAQANAWSNAVGANHQRIRLRNISSGVTVLSGVNENAGIVNASTTLANVANLMGRFVLGVERVFELHHWVTTASGSSAASNGESEVFSDVLIHKVA